jgi:chaperonin GroES
MTLKPLLDHVVIKRREGETQSPDRLIVLAKAERPDEGDVLAVGPGKRNAKGDFIAPGVKAGDRVLFGKFTGQTVHVDGDELLVMREEDIFAVVDGQAETGTPLKGPQP